MPAWENLSDFLSLGDFAVKVKVTLESGEVREFPGIFDDPYLNADLGEYEVDTSTPRVLCKMSDALGIQRGDTMEVEGVVYDIMRSPKPDGTGLATILGALQSGHF